MTSACSAFDDVALVDGRRVSVGAVRRLLRRLAGRALMSLAAVAAAGLLLTIATFAAAWIVNAALTSGPHMQVRAPMGPGALALAPSSPSMAGPASVAFADKWARATGSMQARAVPLLTPHTQVAALPPAETPERIAALPLPPQRPAQQANLVPLPRAYPMPREIAAAAAETIVPPAAPQLALATPAPAEKRLTPPVANKSPELLDSRTAVYDISARTVYMPNGARLEAHSGLGEKIDDPRFVKLRMRGPTPPNVYELALREKLFHGVRAIRLNPVDEDRMHGRDGMLAHTYMLGPNGQSNGCVSFKDYREFLNAYLNGEVERLVVVADGGAKLALAARARRGHDKRFASNN